MQRVLAEDRVARPAPVGKRGSHRYTERIRTWVVGKTPDSVFQPERTPRDRFCEQSAPWSPLFHFPTGAISRQRGTAFVFGPPRPGADYAANALHAGHATDEARSDTGNHNASGAIPHTAH